MRLCVVLGPRKVYPGVIRMSDNDRSDVNWGDNANGLGKIGNM